MEDRASFEAAVEPLLQALHAHCYRFVGGMGQSDDLVQEDACLDELRRARPRLSPWTDDAPAGGEWVEPYPDGLLDGLADPAGRYSLRESVSLAFVTALQLLSPRQRASLILRDVLDWRAAEVAALLEVSTAAVESALARARTVIEESRVTERVPDELDEEARAFLDRYVAAWEAADVDAIAVLLREDVRYGMPPLPLSFRGREGVRQGLAATAFVDGARYRMLLTRAGGPAPCSRGGGQRRLRLWFALRVCGLSLTATFMAAALAASGTAAPQMNHTCSNGGYLQRWRTANDLFNGAVQSIKAGRIVAAAAYVQRARRRVQSAPPPCNSKLLVARAHTLKEYAETLLYLRAMADGDIASAIVYLQRALHEQDVVAPLLAPYRSRAGTVRAAGP